MKPDSIISSPQGRFLRSDPDNAGAFVLDPQSWNGYSYVRNDPVNLIDPDGRSWLGDIGGAIADWWNSEPTAEGRAWTDFWNSWDQLQFFYAAMSRLLPSGPPQGPQTPAKPSGIPRKNEAPSDPCQYAGRNLGPSAWEAMGKDTKNNPFTTYYDLKYGFAIGGYLDAQPMATGTVYERAAYGNYVFGTYMSAAGFPLWMTLSGANAIAKIHKLSNPTQYRDRVMDQNYSAIPAANVANITAGYNAQRNFMPQLSRKLPQTVRMKPKTLERARSGTNRVPPTHKSVLLLVLGVCFCSFGCEGPKRTWSAESRSPDGKMIATAYTDQTSGIGTGNPGTFVYLNWTSGSQPPTVILALTDGSYESRNTQVEMKWLTPTHLELSYNGDETVEFQAIRCHGVDILLKGP